MSDIDTLFGQYQILIDYCDRFFDDTFAANPEQMKCGKGCSACCLLQSVNELETEVISRWLAGNPLPGGAGKEGYCPFLRDDACSIYPARPLICRTHGLLVSDENGAVNRTCDLNFTEEIPHEFNGRFVFKAAQITENLMRLNMAYCILSGRDHENPRRILLRDLYDRAR
jgi:Fe-S-cluster containining protein